MLTRRVAKESVQCLRVPIHPKQNDHSSFSDNFGLNLAAPHVSQMNQSIPSDKAIYHLLPYAGFDRPLVGKALAQKEAIDKRFGLAEMGSRLCWSDPEERMAVGPCL